MPLIFQLTPEQTGSLLQIATGGLTRSIYHQISMNMVSWGFGWATASGALKNVYPEFRSLLLADVWETPYLRHRQEVDQSRTDKNTLIPEKHMVKASFSEDQKYLYNMTAYRKDDNGNDIVTGHYQYYSDEYLTPNEAEDNAFDAFNKYTSKGLENADTYHFNYMQVNREYTE